MTMMAPQNPFQDDPELLFIGSLNQHKINYMVSHRIWRDYFPAGQHMHPFYEILIHHRNGDRIVVGEKIYPMQPNEFYVISPYQIHDMICEKVLNDYERICIYVTESMLTSAGLNVVSILDAFTSAAVGQHHCFQLTEEEYETIYKLSQSMHNCTFDPRLSSLEKLENSLVVIQILYILYRVMDRSKLEIVHGNNNPMIINVLSFISEHFAESLSLDQIAQRFNISKYHLSHEFKRTTGTSIYQYLLICRINYAKELIISGESITNVAYRSGFNNYSCFLHDFQKVTGETPSEFYHRFRRPRPKQ